MAALEVRSVSKAFGATQALSDVNLSVESGEIHALVGENGSGKSTLMRVMHGEVRADIGEMTLESVRYAPSSPRDAVSKGIALIHQELAVCPHLTVAENIFLGAEIQRYLNIDRRAMNARSRELLGRLGHGDLNPETLIRNLSPALQQVVEIARALRSDARVLLFDEPTSSLGREDVDALFRLLRELREQGRAIVYISHFLDEVMEIADRATILRDGEIVGIMGRNEFSTDRLAELMVGRTIAAQQFRIAEPREEIAISTNQLTGHRAPHQVSIAVRKGEVFGIAGLNGAGRTETLRALFGLDRIRSGVVHVNGDPTVPDARKSWRRHLGIVSEDRKAEGLALNLTIAENLTLPAMRGAIVNRPEQTQRTINIIEKLRVKCTGPGQIIRNLSGGNQQKVALGRLLDSQCEILLLDEPTRGIDIGSKAEIYDVINKLAAEGKTILIASSYLPELTDLCHRIAILRRGELVRVVDPREKPSHEIMEACAGA